MEIAELVEPVLVCSFWILPWKVSETLICN